MVGMRVRVEDGIDLVDTLANGLYSKIGRRVHEKRALAGQNRY
jgi:hypothetical protein